MAMWWSVWTVVMVVTVGGMVVVGEHDNHADVFILKRFINPMGWHAGNLRARHNRSWLWGCSAPNCIHPWSRQHNEWPNVDRHDRAGSRPYEKSNLRERVVDKLKNILARGDATRSRRFYNEKWFSPDAAHKRFFNAVGWGAGGSTGKAPKKADSKKHHGVAAAV